MQPKFIPQPAHWVGFSLTAVGVIAAFMEVPFEWVLLISLAASVSISAGETARVQMMFDAGQAMVNERTRLLAAINAESAIDDRGWVDFSKLQGRMIGDVTLVDELLKLGRVMAANPQPLFDETYRQMVLNRLDRAQEIWNNRNQEEQA